jgi:hypothetical protein
LAALVELSKNKGDYMKYTKYLLAIAFAVVMLIGSTAVSTQAQRRGGRIIYRRPGVVRPYYVNPYYYGYDPFWSSWYNPYFGDPYFYDPYLRERQQLSYLQNELRGNERELRKHLEKYNADGVITEKERKELDDDYRDVARAKRQLNEFNRGR